MRLGLLEAQSTDPYRNLALERYLLETVEDDQVILYLWQNANTVVIGRNQSALGECRVQQLEADGGHLARRLSGGGAVYHDLGNLNFTFLMPSELFDEAKQTQVVLRAVQMLGIAAVKTGRNDLLAGGAKFSGHAYYHTKGKSYHHGTLLVNVDASKMAAYLNPSPLKLASKGVASVKSRVCNLADLADGLTVADVSRAMIAAFEEVYGSRAVPVELDENAEAAVAGFAQTFASDAWLYRKETVLEHSNEAKFDWGLVRVDWSCALWGDSPTPVLGEVALYSDGLDAEFLEQVPAVLRGCPVNAQAMTSALSRLGHNLPLSSFVQRAACVDDIVSLIA